MPRAYLGLGTNVGDRGANIRAALRLLAEVPGLTIVRRSSIYETAPVGVEDQPNFLNMVVAVETGLSPHDLLKAAKFIEQRMGRQAGPRWGPRVIDVDILLWGETPVIEPGLIVPHPRMWERAFVMVPLAEIAGDLTGPDGRSARDLARQAQGRVWLWGEGN
jgi:2-amino-4-hydroxy-6-hydroxymethyldihydropteridine diphosphokinase